MPNQAEANLSALIESTEDLIWSVDLDYRLITFNRALQQTIQNTFGVQLAAGMCFHDVLQPERAVLWPPFYQRALSQGPFRVEYSLLVGGRTLDLAFNPIVVDGEKIGISIFGKDITEQKSAEKALQEAEKDLRNIFDGAIEGIFRSSPEGKPLVANRAALKILGYDSLDDLKAVVTNVRDHLWVARDELASFNRQIVKQGALHGFKCRVRRKDGAIIWCSLSARRVYDADGRYLYLEGFIIDITERIQSEVELRQSEERYRTAFQTSLDAININRLSDGKYIDCNQAFLNIFGYEREEVIGRTSLQLGIWADPLDRRKIVAMLRENSNFRGLETQFKKKNGEVFWGEMSASEIEIDGVPCVLSMSRDLSDAKAAENTIRSLAFYDPLTGLPNRRLLVDKLHQALAASSQSGNLQALLLVDVDNFKALKETLGHRTGNLLLQEVARRIAACAHGASAVGRWGGDQFVAILEDLSEFPREAAAQAKAAGEKILAAVGQSYPIEDRECLPTASIGITVFGDRQYSADELLQQADIALHQAKAVACGSIRFFSPAMQFAVNARAALEDDLRAAIKTNQFSLYYQPQMEKDHLTGVEALIRWNHPTRGLVMPDDFIPAAEEARLILPIGDWVLEAACSQLASWADRKQTNHLTIAVNISALQFRQPGFVDRVLQALDRTKANPKRLRLEITESMLVENLDDLIPKMAELKSHGLRFSLDDFGKGYSSLSYLKRLPLDRLKIDRSFVRDMLLDDASGAIAQTIISLGRAMRLSVIAEGVETQEQRGFLTGLGCHSFQGYLFSRPLPLEQFHAFLENFS
jgi:diguanylate cyclase (GGDEF)-like protein/PAS domain S-box-containing protein